LLVAAAAAALHDRRVARRSLSELRTFIDATLKPDASKRLRLIKVAQECLQIAIEDLPVRTRYFAGQIHRSEYSPHPIRNYAN
jgi:hypothetical protein